MANQNCAGATELLKTPYVVLFYTLLGIQIVNKNLSRERCVVRLGELYSSKLCGQSEFTASKMSAVVKQLDERKYPSQFAVQFNIVTIINK